MKNILILGATSDIGVALAKKYALEGCSVTLAARDAKRLEAIITDLKIRTNHDVEGIAFDALKFKTHQEFYDGLSVKPDIAICVFGYLGDHDKAKEDFTEARKIIDSNYTGTVSILNIIANDLDKRGEGQIIGISSVAGDRGRQSNYYYGSAKAGFSAYLSGLRNRLIKSGVHVMTVKPGFVNTAMTKDLDLPAALTAEPDEVAEDIYKASLKQKDVLYTKWFWKFVMGIIIHIPEFIFKKLSL